MQQKTKKLTSWILLFSLLISVFTILPVSAEPAESIFKDTDDGCDAKYELKIDENTTETKYFNFDKNTGETNRNLELDQIPDGATVTLLKDVEIDSELYIRGNFTLDGNGKKFTGQFRSCKDSAKRADGSDFPMNVTVKNLTIETNTLTGTSNSRYLYQMDAGATCTFDNCTITVNGVTQNAAVVAFGNLTFKDCGIYYNENDTKPFFYDNGYYKVTLSGTQFFKGKTGTEPGTKINISDEASALGLAAKNGDTYYTNAMDATGAAKAGDTVELLKDVTIADNALWYLHGSYTIEGNNHIITGGLRTECTTPVSVTIQNAKIKASSKLGQSNCPAYLYQINAGNTCTFKNCTITINGTPSFGAIILRGTLNFDNTTVTYTTTGDKPLFFDGNNTGKVNFSNGTKIEVEGNSAKLFATKDANLGKVENLGKLVIPKENISFTAPEITNTSDWAIADDGITPEGGSEGLRVKTEVQTNWADGLEGVTITDWGTHFDKVADMTKTENEATTISVSKLLATNNKYNTIKNNGWFKDGDCFYGVLTGLSQTTAEGLAAISYITVEIPGYGTFTYYGNGAFFQQGANEG